VLHFLFVLKYFGFLFVVVMGVLWVLMDVGCIGGCDASMVVVRLVWSMYACLKRFVKAFWK
jgi:hypothetical protein